MEEISLAAKAYYYNSPTNIQELARNFFHSIDTNRDGCVSFSEFMQFLQQNGYNWVNPNMFNNLHTNRNGVLDVWEVLTFYYIVKTRSVWCDVCRANLHGLYFTCVECFDSGNNTYDLCPSCYAARTFSHHHSVFLDSFVLLRNKRGLSHGTSSYMGTMSHIQPPLRPNAPALGPSRPCPPAAAGHGGNMPLMSYAPLAVGVANVAVGAGTLISQGAGANGNDAGFADATSIVNADDSHAVEVASNCPMM